MSEKKKPEDGFLSQRVVAALLVFGGAAAGALGVRRGMRQVETREKEYEQKAAAMGKDAARLNNSKLSEEEIAKRGKPLALACLLETTAKVKPTKTTQRQTTKY